MKEIRIKRLCLLFSILACFLLVWCGSKWNNKNEFIVNIWGFELEYAWNVELSKVPLKTDDLGEIVDLYQEVWDNVWYRDSLLIAQKYSQLWVNAFVQENLDTLEDNGLTLSNINKKQILFEKDWKDVNAVLLEYEITEWFVEEIPILYISQLFIPDWGYVWLISFITENQSSRSSVSNAFKQIK
jgi:hypothetical protein